MIKSPKDQPEEIFLESSQFDDEEETLWISGRAPLEAILTKEGLSIFPLFSLDDIKKRNG